MKSYPFLLSTCKRYCHSCVEAQVTANAYGDMISPPWENQQRRANLRSRCIKAEPRSRGGGRGREGEEEEKNFSNAANAKASARRQSNISRWESTGVPRGWRAPPKYCLLGELCLSRLSVCPIHFTSSVPHSPFALARCFSSD